MNLLVRLLIVLNITTGTGVAFASDACSDFFSNRAHVAAPAVLAPQFANERVRILAEFEHPYTLAHDVKLEFAKSKVDARAWLNNVLGILNDTPPSLEQGSKLNSHIDSEAQALLVAEILMRNGLGRYAKTIDHLFAQNLYFGEAHPIRGPPGEASRGLVTFAFEKEGFNPDISMLYRQPEISESKWMALKDQERIQLLQSMNLLKKEFLPPEVVAPTELKPPFLGGFQIELSDAQRKGWSWEVAHKRFEISRARIMSQVKSLAQFFKETHSFHFHIVFDLPKKYKFYSSFVRWYKQVNDYLYLRGVEERLHGNYLTAIANDKRDLSWWERIRMLYGSVVSTNPVIGEKQSALTRYSQKFFSMGLRGGDQYGPGSSPEMMKVGLELRDTTRSLDSLDAYTRQITEAVTEYRWEKINTKLDQAQLTPRLSTGNARGVAILAKHVPKKWASLFQKLESSASIPLLEYELGHYFNFRTGEFEQPSVEKVKQLTEARAIYLQSMTNLVAELTRMEAGGEKLEVALIQTAIRISISEWAAQARASELYANY